MCLTFARSHRTNRAMSPFGAWRRKVELDLQCVQPHVNWLLLPSLKRKANTCTDSADSIGRAVLTQALRDAGIKTGYLAVGQPPPPNSIVLMSLTSSFDVAAAIAHNVSELKQSRPDVTIIAGGPGAQNPHAIASFARFVFLGRAEAALVSIVQAILTDNEPRHASLVDCETMNPATYCQAQELWTTPIRLQSISRYWTESFVGCPHLCAYCHYGYARRFKSESRKYNQISLTPSNPEIRLEDIAKSTARRIRTSIDGCSERIRLAFGKNISNDQIADAMVALNDRQGTMLAIYNIGNAPSESDADRREFDQSLIAAANRCKQSRKRLNVLIQTTPFRPSPLTPLAIAPASLWPNWHDRASDIVADTPSVLIQHSFGNESPKSHLTSLAVERHDGSEAACNTLSIVSSKRFQTASVADALGMVPMSEIDRLCRAYDWDGLPTAPWTSWVDQSAIVRRSERLQRQLGWRMP
jgi:hypothetical protein